MFKMGSHDPFGYLKHKLWPKEKSGLKLTIWLPTTKSQESPWFTCVHVMCNILLECSKQKLQICFRPHLIRRSTQEVMGPQSCQSVNFGTPNLGVSRQNNIWVLAPWPGTESIMRGKVLASPKFMPRWVLWICVCMWFVRAPKMFQLHTNELVVWFVQVYVNNWPAYHSS
jgi:hypothetical protein